MRRVLLGAVFAVVCGCGGDSPDFAPNFAGLWSGTLSATDSAGDSLGSFDVIVNIEETSRNQLELFNACIESTGPKVTSTSATAFASTEGYSCRPVGDGQCSTIVETWNSLSGSLTGSTMTFTAQVTAAGCGDTGNDTFAFTDLVRVQQ
jgi:hypothetical protein